MGRRINGYHEIRSIFYKIPLYDEIVVEESDELRIHFIGERIDPKNNTIYKAIRILKAFTGKEFNLSITVYKNIPPGSGLGGASSNAATIIKYLNGAYDLGLPEEEILMIAKQIGSDVPFFIHDAKLAIVEGIGDKVQPLNLDFPFNVVLFVPDIVASTKDMYELLDRYELLDNPSQAERNIRNIIRAIEREDYEYINENLHNTFEKVFFQVFPKALDYKRKMEVWGKVHLSGSGSTLFCIVKDRFRLVAGV